MPVLQSVQQRKLTSILINHKNCQLFRTLLALSFIHFFRRPVFVWQKSCLLTALYPQVFVVVVLVSLHFSFAVLPAIFVSYTSFQSFFLPFFSRQLSLRNVVENVYRLFLLSFSHFRLQILSSASVAQTNFYFDKSQKNCQLFRTLLALSFVHFFCRPAFVWQTSCLLTALYPQVFVVVVLVSLHFSFAVLPAIFVSYTSFQSFFLPFFSRQLSFRIVVENVYRLFLLSFSHFRLQILSSAG